MYEVYMSYIVKPTFK